VGQNSVGVDNKRLLALIGRYLRAGVLVGEHIEPRENFVERVDLVVPPTADPHGGWYGGWGPDTPGDPISRQFAQ
jgi:hypothetical protein